LRKESARFSTPDPKNRRQANRRNGPIGLIWILDVIMDRADIGVRLVMLAIGAVLVLPTTT
jgi:hypothetical protein